MPCWEKNTIKIDLNSGNSDLLEEVLKEMGIKYSKIKWGPNRDEYLDFTLGGGRLQMGVNLTKGTFVFGNDQSLVAKANEIKRNISKKIVKQVAARKRWVVKAVNDRKMRVRRY